MEGPNRSREATSSEGHGVETFVLAGLLWCAGCDGELGPVRVLHEPLAYGCSSGCRRTHIHATTIERLVCQAVERHTPALLAGVPAECHAQLYRQLIARVVVGAAPNDIAITWRI